MNLDGQGSSVMVLYYQFKDLRFKSVGLLLKLQVVGLDEESYDDDEFESVGFLKLLLIRISRMLWMEIEYDMIDMLTQIVVYLGNRMGNIIFFFFVLEIDYEFRRKVQI